MQFNHFLTPWIAFWAFWGIAVGIIHGNKQIMRQNNQFVEQIHIQEKQLLETRFSSGVGLLGNANESARIGGAYNLCFLADEFPKEYLEPVCEILCAHIRTITNNKDYPENYKEKPSNEVQTIINLLFQKNQKDSLIFFNCRKDLKRTFLNVIDFSGIYINNVDFWGATISNVNFKKALISNVDFVRATIDKGTIFNESKLKKVYFNNAVLNDVSFSRARLNDVSYSEAVLVKNHFDNAKFSIDSVNFYKTPLAGKNLTQITCNDCALNLTTPKQ
jgi:hypothetical protein